MSSPSNASVQIRKEGAVTVISLQRPHRRNAVDSLTAKLLFDAFLAFDQGNSASVAVLTGDGDSFCAGADLKAVASGDHTRMNRIDRHGDGPMGISRMQLGKPVIAAVSGYALGGGCELAMMCDMIIAADNAKFAQPEIKLGIVPGSGGTQRLTRAVSKSKAMDLCLTGRMMDAAEAERSGLVARVYPAAQLIAETMAIAQTIAAMPLLTLMMVKESVNAAYETTLSEGIRYERRLFHACFGTEDQKEGMSAFLEKRPAQFKNR